MKNDKNLLVCLAAIGNHIQNCRAYDIQQSLFNILFCIKTICYVELQLHKPHSEGVQRKNERKMAQRIYFYLVIKRIDIISNFFPAFFHFERGGKTA